MANLVYYCILLLLLGNDSEYSQSHIESLPVMGHINLQHARASLSKTQEMCKM